MAQRTRANKRAATERGELRTPLPVGLVHDDAGNIVIDPDAEVQAAIRDVFAACGSAYGVVAAFADWVRDSHARQSVGSAALRP